MSIDRFGLGGWWPRPEQAAAGALDRLPADQWPMLAARWLAAGFDSPSLRQLAQFQTGDAPASLRVDHRSSSHWGGLRAQPVGRGQPVPPHVQRLQRQHRAARDEMALMPEVLRSLGFDPAPADEAFVARCQSALDVVQHDLDVTGYGRYRMRARFGLGWPSAVYPALPDGSYWGGNQGMSREEDDSSLLFSAAGLVSGTLKEIPEIEWPVCAVHGGHPDSIWAGEEPVRLVKKMPWWQCTNTGHPLAPVGQLTAEIAKTM